MSNHINLVRHLLATMAYRFQYAVRDAPKAFPDYDPGNEAIPPLDLVRHINILLDYVSSFFGEPQDDGVQSLDWDESISRFHALLSTIDQRLEAESVPNGVTFETLLQGPLADALTHIGQLALLRRLSGSPVQKGRFRDAKIEIGKVGMDQEFRRDG